MGSYTLEPFIDNIVKEQLEIVKKRVLNKDRDFVAVYDGEEGSGKSVLVMQHALALDPNFNIDKVVFTSDSFIKLIKDPKTTKGSCIVLDEAFNAANSRASLTEVNRSMIGLATEMRQKNLFVLLVLPSFFDLDKYFALWRCRALFHVYFTTEEEREEERHYIIFPKDSKKLLYLAGKKTYNYNYPRSPFPPCKFFDQYVVDEAEYRAKKAEAFKHRVVSNQARNWMIQRNALVKYLVRQLGLTFEQINQLLLGSNALGLSPAQISFIMNELSKEDGYEGGASPSFLIKKH